MTSELARPDAFLPRRLADTHALILPKDAPLSDDHLIGTGAFRWQVIAGGVRLSAHDHHFAGRPLIDEVELYRVEPLSEEPGLHVAGAQAQTVSDWQTEVGVHFLIWNAGQRAAQNEKLRAALHELHDIRRFWQDTRQPWPLLTAQSFYPRRSAQREPYGHSDEQARGGLARCRPCACGC